MDRCSDRRKLSELDPVTFFIVTEIMMAEREQAAQPEARKAEPAATCCEHSLCQVA